MEFACRGFGFNVRKGYLSRGRNPEWRFGKRGLMA